MANTKQEVLELFGGTNLHELSEKVTNYKFGNVLDKHQTATYNPDYTPLLFLLNQLSSSFYQLQFVIDHLENLER